MDKLNSLNKFSEIAELCRKGGIVLYSGNKSDIACSDYAMTACVQSGSSSEDIWWVDSSDSTALYLVCRTRIERFFEQDKMEAMLENYEAYVFECGEPEGVKELAVVLKELFDKGLIQDRERVYVHATWSYQLLPDAVSLEKVRLFAEKVSKGVSYNKDCMAY